jgi:hypothetical protein
MWEGVEDMTIKYWVKERNKQPPTWCPYEIESGNVVLGMNLITLHPPGTEAGWFWFEEDGKLNTLLELSVALERERILRATTSPAQGEEE